MKIIHCADLHLESHMKSNLTEEKAKERRDELLDNFDRLVKYAKDEDVKYIMISGDIFDRGNRRKSATKHIVDLINDNPEITFLLLMGNHDVVGVYDDEYFIPENVKLFNDKEWVQYDFDDVVISGIELSKDNYKDITYNLVLDPARCNIVMLHSGPANYDGEKEIYEINFNELKNKNIDYLALGHIHKYMKERLDERGTYVYPGCLEGRGFDETGEKGFVLLDVNDGVIEDVFVPFARRRLHEIEVVVEPDDNMKNIIDNVHDNVDLIPSKDLIKVVLTGKTDMNNMVDIDVRRIINEFAERFYFFKVQDKTTVQVDYESFINDKSLKGEFVRLLEKEELEDDRKSTIVELGIKALMGEDLSI